jgi:hypothetical protein
MTQSPANDGTEQAAQPKELFQILEAFEKQHNAIMASMQNFIGVMTKDMAGKLGTYMTGLYTTLEHQSQELVLLRTFEAGVRSQTLTQENVTQLLDKLTELRKAQADIARKFLSEAGAASPKQQG